MSASVGDIYSVAVNYTGPGGVYQNVFGFKAIANIAGDAQLALGAAFQTAMVKNTSGGLLYGLASDVSSASLWVDDVKPGTLARYVRAYSAVAGSNGGDSLPPQCAVLFSAKTALKGRSYRGRFYLPGATEDEVTDGVINGASITSFTTIATQLMAVFGPGGSDGTWAYAVISRWLNKVQRATPVATEVVSLSLDPIIATMRPRRLGS